MTSCARQVRAIRHVSSFVRPASNATPARPAFQHSLSGACTSQRSQLQSVSSRFLSGGSKHVFSRVSVANSQNISTRSFPVAMAETTPSGAQATKFPAGEEKAQQDSQPGKEHQMQVKPETVPKHYKPSGKLEGKVALITGELIERQHLKCSMHKDSTNTRACLEAYLDPSLFPVLLGASSRKVDDGNHVPKIGGVAKHLACRLACSNSCSSVMKHLRV
jgi:hypothetical protein